LAELFSLILKKQASIQNKKLQQKVVVLGNVHQIHRKSVSSNAQGNHHPSSYSFSNCGSWQFGHWSFRYTTNSNSKIHLQRMVPKTLGHLKTSFCTFCIFNFHLLKFKITQSSFNLKIIVFLRAKILFANLR
jgi:hypothetical protein